MIGILPWWWRWALLAVVIVASMAFGAAKMHEHDQVKYDKLEVEYSKFKGGVEAIGVQAQADTKAKEAKDKTRKETADHENLRTIADLNSAITRLRDDADRTRGGFVPGAPAGSSRADLACFDRPALESAVRDLVVEVRGQADKGTAATVDLNTARKWAQEK